METVADAYVNFLTDHAVPKAMTLFEIQEATKNDPTLQRLAEIIGTNKWDSISKITDERVNITELKLFSKLKHELTLNEHSNVILRDTRLVMPHSLRKKLIKISHEGHQGLAKTKRLLRTKIWFPQIDKMVEEMIAKCIPCQATGPPNRPEPLQMNVLPPSPWHTVHIDFCGPFPTGEYLLVVIDAYSRFPEVDVVSSTSAKVTVPKLERIFATHGIPHILKSDNGPPFPGREFYAFMKELGTKHKPSIPLSPQGNGEVESFMKPLEKAICTAVAENKYYKRVIFKFLLNYRATPHSTTGKSPAELLFNRKIHTKLPELVLQNKAEVHQELEEKDRKAKSKMKEYADKNSRAMTSEIKVGDTVLVRQQKANKLSTRFGPQPYTVTARKGARVTVCRKGHFITRNVSFFKKIPDNIDQYTLEDNESDHEFDFDLEPDQAQAQEAEHRNRYPVRDRQAVKRYGNNIFDR